MNIVPEKKCTKCGEYFSEFYKSYPSRCKKCVLKQQKEYAAANREQEKERARKWRQDNPEKNKEAKRSYYRTNLEKIQDYIRNWRESNSDRVKELNQRWYKEHPDWVQEKHSKRRANIRGSGGKFTAKEWRELKEKHSYTCLACGRSEPEIKLTPDHVLPLKLGGVNSIDNIQPLCGSCNSSKKAKHIDYRY